MMTLVDAVCAGGDRQKQNDDALGIVTGPARTRAFVIDGATDLADTPLMPAASDASWIARFAQAHFHAEGAQLADTRALVRRASLAARQAYLAGRKGEPQGKWQWPTASFLMASEREDGRIEIADLGDCRAYALGADGQIQIAGGRPRSKDEERSAAAKMSSGSGNARYRSPEALAYLRDAREWVYDPSRKLSVFCIEPDCAEQVRLNVLEVARPSYLLLATDGFSALEDAYGAFSPQALVEAAIALGLNALSVQLRAIENADDPQGGQFARWKRSDDATAMLLRLE